MCSITFTTAGIVPEGITRTQRELAITIFFPTNWLKQGVKRLLPKTETIILDRFTSKKCARFVFVLIKLYYYILIHLAVLIWISIPSFLGLERRSGVVLTLIVYIEISWGYFLHSVYYVNNSLSESLDTLYQTLRIIRFQKLRWERRFSENGVCSLLNKERWFISRHSINSDPFQQLSCFRYFMSLFTQRATKYI